MPVSDSRGFPNASLLLVLEVGQRSDPPAAGRYWLRHADTSRVVADIAARARTAGRPVVRVANGSAQAPVSGRATGSPEGDVVVRRSGPSAFDGAELDQVLGRRHLERVVIVGDGDPRTVSATVEDLLARGASVAVVTDAIVARDAGEARGLARTLRRHGVSLVRARTVHFRSEARLLGALEIAARPGPTTEAQIRTQLLSALATAIAREGGFAAAHMARVARDAQLSLRTVYEVFPGGKADAFLALYAARVDVVEQAITAAVEGMPPGREAALRACTVGVGVVAANQSLARALLHEAPLLDEGAGLHEATMRRFAGLLRAQLPPAGRERLGPVAAQGLFGALVSLGLSPAARDDELDPITDAVDRMLDGLLHPDDARHQR